jgi:hypothetical protein
LSKDKRNLEAAEDLTKKSLVEIITVIYESLDELERMNEYLRRRVTALETLTISNKI